VQTGSDNPGAGTVSTYDATKGTLLNSNFITGLNEATSIVGRS
jgi:hypothetical protein